MQDLRIVGTEDGSLLLVAEDGTRFRLAIDEALHAKVRASVPAQGTGRKLSPREIQSHIRSGMTAAEVSSVTGASLEYVERFEGPVLAEREFVVDSALTVPVHTAADVDPLGDGQTFGGVILERLRDIGGTDERWASWKEPSGWVVKLTFLVGEVEHDARWEFDPKRHTLSPLNAEAISLSQQSQPVDPLIPRLRAVVDVETPAERPIDRFDSGAFRLDHSAMDESGPVLASAATGRITPVERAGGNQTADLLEALRRRRGERDAPVVDEDERSAHPSTSGIRLVELPVGIEDPAEAQRETSPQPRGKKSRPSMPSWDEIVFGARPDDDLA